MGFSFTSLGHAIASGMQEVAKGMEWITKEAETVVEPTEGTVESITSVIAGFLPQAGLVLTFEKVGYGALGVIIAGLKSGDAAFRQNLLNAGADESFIQEIEAIIDAFPSIIQGATTAFKSQSAATTAGAQKASLASVQATHGAVKQLIAAKGAKVANAAPKSTVLPAALDQQINAGITSAK